MKVAEPDSVIDRLHHLKSRPSRMRQRACLGLTLVGLISAVSGQTISQDVDALSRNGFEGLIESLPFLEPSAGGIKEVIPFEYEKRYRDWKNEFLATETGRRQWESYAHHPRLVLTITVSRDKPNGATTGEFKWDDSGNLVRATITLGRRIDEGYPDPIYYPVLYSLEELGSYCAVSGSILAAAKIAHEFDHVNQAGADGVSYRLQNEMVRAYNAILLSKGHKTRDPRLIELAVKMGNTPVEICEDREHRSETNALRYLLERLTSKSLRRALLIRIRKTIELYATSYQERFVQVIQSRGHASQVAASSSRPGR